MSESDLICLIGSAATTYIVYENFMNMMPEKINVSVNFSFHRVWLLFPLLYIVPNASYKLYKKIYKYI